MADKIKIPADLYEECLRAYHKAPSHMPSLLMLKTFEEDPIHFELAIEIAYNRGLTDACADIHAQMFKRQPSKLWGKEATDDRPAEETPADAGR